MNCFIQSGWDQESAEVCTVLTSRTADNTETTANHMRTRGDSQSMNATLVAYAYLELYLQAVSSARTALRAFFLNTECVHATCPWPGATCKRGSLLPSK